MFGGLINNSEFSKQHLLFIVLYFFFSFLFFRCPVLTHVDEESCWIVCNNIYNFVNVALKLARFFVASVTFLLPSPPKFLSQIWTSKYLTDLHLLIDHSWDKNLRLFLWSFFTSYFPMEYVRLVWKRFVQCVSYFLENLTFKKTNSVW